MAIVRKAVLQDFQKAYPLFVKFNNPRLSKNDWQQLFVDHWRSNEGYFGYVLEDKERIVGFLGLMFSRRVINVKEEKFCNRHKPLWRKDLRRAAPGRHRFCQALIFHFGLCPRITGSDTRFTFTTKQRIDFSLLGFVFVQRHIRRINNTSMFTFG